MQGERRSLLNFLQPYCIVLGVVEGKRACHNLSSVLKKWAPRSSKQSWLMRNPGCVEILQRHEFSKTASRKFSAGVRQGWHSFVALYLA